MNIRPSLPGFPEAVTSQPSSLLLSTGWKFQDQLPHLKDKKTEARECKLCALDHSWRKHISQCPICAGRKHMEGAEEGLWWVGAVDKVMNLESIVAGKINVKQSHHKTH